MPTTKLHRALAACAAALLLTSAGCGGGDDGGPIDAKRSDRAADAPKIGAVARPTIQRSLLAADDGATASAGTSASYEPTGEIIADSGFRPEKDGFSFENYGNDVGPENLTTAEVQALFGDQVCVGGDGEDCKLIPPARRWMENENARMNGGHCMGFSVAAIRMFEGKLDPATFGADSPSALEIRGNTDLQSSIAEHWVYQDLPLIQDKIRQGTPTEILQRLVDVLNDGKEDYTLGILMADGTGGHAITPFAVEDKGDGTYAILVYDNNFPGVTRAVTVDANEDTWRYVGGINPKNLGEVYEGDAETKAMLLLPTKPGEEVQPCPFCSGDQAGEGDGGDLGSVLPKDQQYTEITLGGAVTNHPHLVLSDDKGRQTGIVDGKLKQEIPGVRVSQGFGVRNWEASPEPRFQIPAGTDVAMTIDGSNLKKRAKANIDLTGNGLVVAIDEIRVDPGQQDNVFIDGGGYGLYYEKNGGGDEAPEFYAGVEDGDNAYTFAASAVGLKKGSTMGLLVDRKEKTVLLDADGAKGVLDGKAIFVLVVNEERPNSSKQWLRDDLKLDGRRKDSVVFSYKKTPKAGRSLPLLVGPDGRERIVNAKYQG